MPDRPNRKSAVERYRALWRGGPAPNFKDYLAALANLTPDLLLDLIETDRAERWSRGDRVPAEFYLAEFPILRRDLEGSLVIIYGEFYLRKDLGESPSLGEYVQRFPQHADRLRDQVMWHEAIGPDQHSASGKGPPTVPDLTIGDLLGRGGMSAVYRAIDATTGGPVAVKFMDISLISNETRLARFRREVSSLLRLRHNNIVAGHRTGDFRGQPYLVMELCTAGPLSKYLRNHLLSPAAARNVLRDLAAAVAYAHSNGVIHRDLKPANVLLCPIAAFSDSNPAPADRTLEQPSLPAEFPFIPKVSDFGLAKCLIGTEPGLTATQESLGTPCYMAPELTTGARNADARTDVYGLGSILYELLAGRPPFLGDTPLEVVSMVRDELPVSPHLIRPGIPANLAAVCLRCLQKLPASRFQSVRELAAELG